MEATLDYLTYDKESGKFFWKAIPGNFRKAKVGDQAGCLHHSGYRFVKVLGVTYSEHRLAWFHHYGVVPQTDLDHKNGLRDDNRIGNLRPCNDSLNAGNKKSQNLTSSFKGVSWRKREQKWTAQIADPKQRTLYWGDSEVDAAKAYNKAAKDYFGEYARLNEVAGG